MTDIEVVHDPSRLRYRASIDGEAAGFAEYILTDELIVFTHTEVDRRFEGKGVGSAIARFALEDVRAAGGRKVMPLCPFIRGGSAVTASTYRWCTAFPNQRRRTDMTTTLTDKNGDAVLISLELGSPVSSYIARLDQASAGRADFVDPPGTAAERILFHTEVDDRFGGRGLAGLLVRVALDDSIREKVAVVPACPVFARYLKTHGDEFIAAGGTFRRPTPADIAVATRAARGEA